MVVTILQSIALILPWSQAVKTDNTTFEKNLKRLKGGLLHHNVNLPICRPKRLKLSMRRKNNTKVLSQTAHLRRKCMFMFLCVSLLYERTELIQSDGRHGKWFNMLAVTR